MVPLFFQEIKMTTCSRLTTSTKYQCSERNIVNGRDKENMRKKHLIFLRY
jgi:hypothetical protein